MDKIYDNCCGIDVHKKLIVACFRKGNKQKYASLVQQPESFLKWLTGSKAAAAKWPLWRALHLIGSLCITSLNPQT